MRREASTPRPGWQHKLEQLGFDFYNMEGKAYWTEQACYAFTSDEIDELEAATAELHGICLKAVEYVVANKLWQRMRIPPAWGDYIEQVWRRADPTICGRFDLAYDGKGPPKLLEYNADTPTALYEAAVVQWYWLKDVKPDADQFNSIHEKLIEAWRGILAKLPPEAPGALRPLRGPSRGSRDVGIPARHRVAGGPRRQADRRAAWSAGTGGASPTPTRCRSR